MKYRAGCLTKTATDVALDRAIVFPVPQVNEIVGIRLSPVGVVEKEKPRSIHDLTAGNGTVVERV